MDKQSTKMKCSDCGVDMIHHADKVDYTISLKSPEEIDPFLGGVIEEFHTCPTCGSSASRRAVS